MNPPIRKVVIVGGGTAGWMAAATLAQVFGPLLDIRLVESEQIGTVGVGEATIPQIRLLLSVLGIDEDAFLRATNGTIKLGIQFEGWLRPGHDYMHAFGPLGRGYGLLPFQHYWLRARARGQAGSLWDHSFNYQAAVANRFDRVGPAPESGVDALVHAYHFDATKVAGFLRAFAEQRGVRRIEGRIVAVPRHPESGRIQAVRLEDEQRVAGELFIDCSGFRGLLIGQALEVGYEDWSHWLPCDRAIAVPCARVDPLRPYTRAVAGPAGWQWRIPLQNRIGNGHVYCSAELTDDEARDQLLAGLDGKALDEPRPVRFTTGMRQHFWRHNCIALGLASGFMEPLESTSIHLVQSGIDRLIRLFPDRGFAAANADEYNRQTRFEYERIRDFLILHYHANRREEPFWRQCAAMAVPDTLQRKLDLFRSGGRIHREHEELFTEVGWLQAMIGQGVEPASWHSLAERLSDHELDRFLEQNRAAIAQRVAQLPPHADFVEKYCASDD